MRALLGKQCRIITRGRRIDGLRQAPFAGLQPAVHKRRAVIDGICVAKPKNVAEFVHDGREKVELPGGSRRTVRQQPGFAGAVREFGVVERRRVHIPPVTGAVVVDLMFDLAREKGTAVVLITHDPLLADRADRVFTMMAGELTETTGAR